MIPNINENLPAATTLMLEAPFGNEQHHSKTDILMYYYTSDSFNLSEKYGLEDVAEEVVVTTDEGEDSESSVSSMTEVMPHGLDTSFSTAKNYSSNNSSSTCKVIAKEVKPTQSLDSMMPTHQYETDICDNTKHHKRKITSNTQRHSSMSSIKISGDLSIFNSEVPYIVEDEGVLTFSPEKSTFDLNFMDVAAEEEVITEQEDLVEQQEEYKTSLDSSEKIFSESKETVTSEGQLANETNIDRDEFIKEDSLKTPLQLTMDIESTIMPQSRLWSCDLLIPVVRRGPGFDLIDFINNDFLNNDDILSNCPTSPSVLKTQNQMKWNSHGSKQKLEKEQTVHSSSKRIPNITTRKYVRRQPIMKRADPFLLNKRKRNMSSSSQDYNSSDSDSSNLCDGLLTYQEKRIKNNISSKMSREKRKRELAMKCVELQELMEKNSKLRKEDARLKRVIKYVSSQLYKKG